MERGAGERPMRTARSIPERQPSGSGSTTVLQRLTPEQEAIVERNIALVHHIVSRMTENFPSADHRDDLVQAGLVGLIEATQRFDPDLGFSFSTFAGRRIEGAVLDLLRRADWAPRSVRRNERVLHDIDAELTAALGRKPTAAELGSAMGTTADQIHSIRADVAQASVNALFVRSRATDDDSGEVDGPPATDGPDPQDLEHKEFLGYLRDGIRLLPERHRLVIVGHFFEGKSMTDLGESLGVTQSRASQLKGEALAMLKDGLRHNLDDDAPTPTANRRQQAYNEALGSASTWRERLGRQDHPTA